jgi:hypothetical protein
LHCCVASVSPRAVATASAITELFAIFDIAIFDKWSGRDRRKVG